MSTTEHYCDSRLLPGECLVCLRGPRPYVRIESWAGAQDVDVEILGRTPKRVRIRLLADCQRGTRGDVRLVHPDVVRLRTVPYDTRRPAAPRREGDGR